MNEPQPLHDDKLKCVRHGWRIEKWHERRRKSCVYWAIVSPDGLRLNTADKLNNAKWFVDELTRFIGAVDGQTADDIIERIKKARVVRWATSLRGTHGDESDGYAPRCGPEQYATETLDADLEPLPAPVRLPLLSGKNRMARTSNGFVYRLSPCDGGRFNCPAHPDLGEWNADGTHASHRRLDIAELID